MVKFQLKGYPLKNTWKMLHNLSYFSYISQITWNVQVQCWAMSNKKISWSIEFLTLSRHHIFFIKLESKQVVTFSKVYES